MTIISVEFLRYRVRQKRFFSFRTIFGSFTPLATQKIKILKNLKKVLRYNHFTHVYQKWQSYDVWFLRYGAWQTEFFVILDYFLPFYPHKTQKIKILKNEKIQLEISSFYTCVPKSNDHMMYSSWNMVWRTDRRTVGQIERRTNKVTYRGGCYKLYSLLNVLIMSFLIFYFSFRFYSTWSCRNLMKHFILSFWVLSYFHTHHSESKIKFFEN